jgi:hypothetical protein
MAADLEGIKHQYFFAASDYYVTGRFAYWEGAMSVCGNLLHHALELYLKGQLWLTVARAELKDDLGHNLPKIWKRFKTTIGDGRLDAFDQTIRDVHGFEVLRYPETIVEKGMFFHFTMTRADLEQFRATDRSPSNVPRYELALEEVDQLVALLFEVCSLTPSVFLRGHLPSADRDRYLARGNRRSDFLRPQRKGDA